MAEAMRGCSAASLGTVCALTTRAPKVAHISPAATTTANFLTASSQLARATRLPRHCVLVLNMLRQEICAAITTPRPPPHPPPASGGGSSRRRKLDSTKSLDPEYESITRLDRKSGNDTAGDHDHSRTQRPVAFGREVGDPGERGKRIVGRAAVLLVAVDLQPAQQPGEGLRSEGYRRAEHNSCIPAIVADQRECIDRFVVGGAVCDQLESRHHRGKCRHHRCCRKGS